MQLDWVAVEEPVPSLPKESLISVEGGRPRALGWRASRSRTTALHRGEKSEALRLRKAFAQLSGAKNLHDTPKFTITKLLRAEIGLLFSPLKMRPFLKWFLRILALLVLAAFVWAAVYNYKRGFTKKWRQFVASEFRKRGVEVFFSKLTLDPFQGLVAREVKVVDTKDHSKVLAEINFIVLDINYGNFIHGEPFLNGISLRDARVSLPVDPADSGSPRIEISKLNAQVLLPPHQFYLSQADADVFGIHFSAAGRFINPEAFHPVARDAGESERKRDQLLTDLIAQIHALRFPAGAPRVEIRFSGDLAEPEKIFVEASLWAEKIRRAGYDIDNLYAALTYRDGVLALSRFAASDNAGGFEANGSFHMETREAALQLRSSLNLPRLLRSWKISDALADFTFDSPPSIELTAHGDFRGAPDFKVLGKVAAQNFSYKKAACEAFEAAFSWDGTRWYARDVKLAHRTGELTMNAMQLPGDFRATMQSTINPKAIAPLLSGKASEVLSEWDFQQSPDVQLSARGPTPDPALCEIAGALKLGRTRFRGVPLNSASSAVRVKDKAVTYEQFRIDRAEGSGTGSFTYDFGKHEVRLAGIKTRLNTTEVAAWIHPNLVRDVVPYKFKTAPNLTINGVVQFAGGKNTNMTIDVDAPGGMEYVFLKKNLSSPNVSGRLLFTDGRLRISNFSASLYSGRVRGSADISLKREAPGHSAIIEVEKIDFPKLTKLYFNYDTAQGALSGNYEFTGRGGDARTMQGHGKVSVLDGDVFAIPVLGPLSGILNGIVPGMGYNVAREASASFNVRGGVIETNDFLVKGQGFEMLGDGRLFILDDKIDFTIRLNAQGIPGVLLFPVSKLFEYVSDGSLSKPVWKPKRLPTL